MISYNPVLTRGTFEVAGQRVKACDEAEAKYKVAKKLGVADYWSLPCECITPTVRVNS